MSGSSSDPLRRVGGHQRFFGRAVQANSLQDPLKDQVGAFFKDNPLINEHENFAKELTDKGDVFRVPTTLATFKEDLQRLFQFINRALAKHHEDPNFHERVSHVARSTFKFVFDKIETVPQAEKAAYVDKFRDVFKEAPPVSDFDHALFHTVLFKSAADKRRGLLESVDRKKTLQAGMMLAGERDVRAAMNPSQTDGSLYVIVNHSRVQGLIGELIVPIINAARDGGRAEKLNLAEALQTVSKTYGVDAVGKAVATVDDESWDVSLLLETVAVAEKEIGGKSKALRRVVSHVYGDVFAARDMTPRIKRSQGMKPGLMG